MIFYTSLSELKDSTYAYLKKRKTKDPCWEGYEQIGMKEKKGRMVPNCVSKKKKKKAD